MNRIVLRALNAPILILMITLGVALQTSLFNSYPFLYLQPDVILLAVVWCGLKRDFTEGGIITLLLANIAEIHSSAPQGLFMGSYMTVYLAVRAANKTLVIPNFSSIVMLTMGASVLWKLVNLLVLYWLDLAGNQWRHTLALLLPGAVMEGAVAIWIYRWLDRFDRATFKNEQARNQLDDEIAFENSEGF